MLCEALRRPSLFHPLKLAGAALMAVLGICSLGCDAPQARYDLDFVYMRKKEKEAADFTPQQKQDVADILTGVFGTPDAPNVPAALKELVSVDRINMAAGVVGSYQDGQAHGLYRQHCAHCHGISGDGKGPTAPYLNPYPRDYRMGVFKFKSTKIGDRPRREDLHRTLINGVAGTSMPSFKLLPESEIEALIDYVILLSIRGEFERALYDEMADELDEGERLLDDDNLAEGSSYLAEILEGIVEKWRDPQGTPIPARPDWDEQQTLVSIQRGRELFQGSVANCVKCHGEAQLGDGERTDYDVWAKSFYDWTAPTNAEKLAELRAELKQLGGLTPRNIIPRNLRSGIYRGGRRPIDVYWRILNGIDGSPMPAALYKAVDADPAMKGLTSDDIWNIVDYVLSLPYEDISTGGPDHPVYMRSRQ